MTTTPASAAPSPSQRGPLPYPVLILLVGLIVGITMGRAQSKIGRAHV